MGPVREQGDDIQALEDDLDRLRLVKRRTEELAATHLDALDVFHLHAEGGELPDLRRERVGVGCFSALAPTTDGGRHEKRREGLASSARCVRSLLVCRDIKRGNADYEPFVGRIVDRYERGQLATYGLDHLNAFTVSQLLPVLREVTEGDPPEALQALIDEALKRLNGELAADGVSIAVPDGDPGSDRRFPPHGYLTHLALVAVAAWGQVDAESARPSLRWSETELYRQIALFTAGNDERCDAYQLGYNLLAQHRCNRYGLGSSLVDLG
ncbi:MAG TPA: hypothetical protein VHE80_05755, partial [Acidimicrobiales bacterium]|nr:hypothetical protein [Acidimicrobiales bacterium]